MYHCSKSFFAIFRKYHSDEEIFSERDMNSEEEDDISDSDDSTDYLLFVTSSNFRRYLGPALQSALTECVASNPANPIQFIAETLEKYSASIQISCRSSLSL